MRRAARTDQNHADIVKALRRCGYLVHDTSSAGSGFPDLVVGTPWGSIVLVEVKDGDRPPSERKLKPKQVKFHQMWAARHPVMVALGVQDCFEQLERMRANPGSRTLDPRHPDSTGPGDSLP